MPRKEKMFKPIVAPAVTKEWLIGKYGKEYQTLIEDVLSWLDKRESAWNLDEPIDKVAFIDGLISKTYSQ